MARRMRPERVSRYFACLRRGLAWLASRSITSTAPAMDFAGLAGIKERVASAKGNFRLIELNDPFERFAVRIDHRSPQLLCQQPSSLVAEAELIFQLSRNCRADMPLECVAIRCAAQNHVVSGSLERCIAVPAVIEV